MDIIQSMAERFIVPGLPAWSGLFVLLLIGLVVLCYAIMPFSVFGVKGRLEILEAQMDEIQSAIRSLALRLPEPPRPTGDDGYLDRPSVRRDLEVRPSVSNAPVLPPVILPERRFGRPEPRVEWPSSSTRP